MFGQQKKKNVFYYRIRYFADTVPIPLCLSMDNNMYNMHVYRDKIG